MKLDYYDSSKATSQEEKDTFKIKIVNDFEDYMDAKNTWYSKKYPNNANDLIAYFSAEYGLDQTLIAMACGAFSIKRCNDLSLAICPDFTSIGTTKLLN